MHDLNSVLAECYQTLNALSIEYSAHILVKMDPEMKKHRWGLCHREQIGPFEYAYTITIAPVLFDECVPIDSLKRVLYHELLHTVNGAFNHQERRWGRFAKKVSEATGLSIDKRVSPARLGIDLGYRNDPSVKFMCQCDKCGTQFVRYRKCSLVEKVGELRCMCGGKYFVVLNKFL